MAIELGEDNIRVNSISPGFFKSEITEGLIEHKGFHHSIEGSWNDRSEFNITDPTPNA